MTAFWLCAALLVVASFFYYPKWQQPGMEATISWDVSGYYLYLPAALIYKDIKQLTWWGEVERKYNPGPGMGGAFQHPSGNYVMKYTMGQALQFLPWFALAHQLAVPLGYPADGFSLPYQAAVSWGGLLIALLGLWFLRRSLLTYFPDRTVAIVLVCIVFGTNYLEYAAISGAMTHNWLFTLYSLLVFSTIRFYRKPSAAWAAAIGLLVGWATLTRPTEIISAMIPLLWGLGSRAALRERFEFFKENLSKIALAAVAAVAVIFLQFAYWKCATGEWMVYSYQDQGFSWLSPHFSDVLFSARAGWLVYSPVMIFAVAGMFLFTRRRLAEGGLRNPTPGPSPEGRGDVEGSAVHVASPLPGGEGSGVGLRPAILIYCITALYITSAWDIWWYGGSLGQRAMVQSYPLWAFALAAFWQWLTDTGKRWLIAGVALAAAAFIYLNLWWTHQAHKGGLFVSEQMTRAYMLKILGRFESERDWLKLLDTNEEFTGEERRNIRLVYANDFENDTTGVSAEAPISGDKSLILNKEQQNSPIFLVYASPADPDAMPRWVRSSLTFRCDPKEWNWWQMTQFIVRFKRGDIVVKERMIRLQRHVDGSETKTVFFDTRLPSGGFDKMEILFWNSGSDKTIRLDDLQSETFD